MKVHVIKPESQKPKKIRVCAYCRVSTESEDQENSLENQKAHYEELIKQAEDNIIRKGKNTNYRASLKVIQKDFERKSRRCCKSAESS